MYNTGIFDSSFAFILVLLMLSPIFIFMLIQIVAQFAELFSIPITQDIDTPCDKIIQSEKDITFEDIKLTTLKKAANGDKAARDWAMKYVFDIQPTDQKVNTKKYNTDESIINDAIAAMVAVKVKKADAVSKIKSLVSKKDYKNVSDLFIDAMSFN